MSEPVPSKMMAKRETSTSSKTEGGAQETSAPVVAEFLLALSQSKPTQNESKKASAALESAPAKAVKPLNHGQLSVVSSAAHPVPEALTQTRIPPLLFADNLSRLDDISFEHYFPDQFNVEMAGYIPSDHDVICGRGRGNFSHTGNQKLLDIIRERQDDYLRSNKRGKGALGKQILMEILMNGGRFIKLKDRDRNVWKVLNYKDVNTKIMHCIRDQINFQRKVGSKYSDDEEKVGKASYDERFGGADLPPTKKAKSSKKLSNYLKNKYQEDDKASNSKSAMLGSNMSSHAVSRAPEAVASDSASSLSSGHAAFLKQKENSADHEDKATGTPKLDGLPLSKAAKAQLAEMQRLGSGDNKTALEAAEALKAAELQAFRRSILGGSSGLSPGFHDLITEQAIADITAQRMAMLSDPGLALQAGALGYPFLSHLSAASALDLNQSLLLARAGLPSASFGLSEHFRRASAGMPQGTDALVQEHIRNYAMQHGGLMGGLSLLGPLGGRKQMMSPSTGAADNAASSAKAE